jgi:hypothetical protein
MKFENIRTIQILILGLDNKFIILKLFSVKYYLFIGTLTSSRYPNFLRKNSGL